MQPKGEISSVQPILTPVGEKFHEQLSQATVCWSVWLSWPPSTNNLYTQKFQRGRVVRFPSTQLRKWKREALIRITAAKLPCFDGPVSLELALIAPDGRHRDASNYVKAIEDSLVAGRVLRGDDARFVRSVRPFWAGMPNRKAAGVTVTIRIVGSV
jgi:Holliday junction resolvase RusA-like endonuclease